MGAWEILALTFVVFVAIGVLASAFLWVPVLILFVADWAANTRRYRHMRLREKYGALIASREPPVTFYEDAERQYAGWVAKFEYHRLWLEENS